MRWPWGGISQAIDYVPVRPFFGGGGGVGWAKLIIAKLKKIGQETGSLGQK